MLGWVFDGCWDGCCDKLGVALKIGKWGISLELGWGLRNGISRGGLDKK